MKKTVKTLAAASAVLALAGVANAAQVDINIYGASAQYLYWNDVADNFLTANGCSNVVQAQDSSKKHGITSGTNCTGFGNNNVTIRYSAKASFESIRSTKGTTNPDSCPTAFERKMASSTAAPNTLTCQKVTLGASDVAGETFVQESHGQKFGPMGGGQWDVTLTGEDASGLASSQPLVVPFGFFVNTAVTAKMCNAASTNTGAYCDTNADCIGTGAACDAPAPIKNITRLQAAQIFNASVSDWSDFGGYFTAQPIVACLRHAGSGTAAALDFAVMRGQGAFGMSVFTNEIPGQFWFNEGSTDLIKCVNGNSTATPTGSAIGAIGYADADQATGVAGTSQNIKLIKYNGVTPSRYALRNGEYDFWTTQWVYENASKTTAAQRPVVDALTAYAADPANIPSTKSKYWATKDEMKFFKSNDGDFITFQGGAANPQLP